MRENVGLFDQTSFSKFLLQEREAAAQEWCNRLCGNRIDVAPGKVVYTQMLNERGGTEVDVTVIRPCSADCF